VAFAAVAAAGAVVRQVTLLLRRRRERAQRELPVAWNVALRDPIWSRASDAATVIAWGSGACAVVAAFGFVGVAVGMAATFGLLTFGMARVMGGWEARALTFTSDGLRVHFRRAELLVRWDNIDGVELTGAKHHLVEITVRSAEAVLASVHPRTARTLRQATYRLADRDGPIARIMFSDWTAGLAAATLARAIRDGAARGDRAATN